MVERLEAHGLCRMQAGPEFRRALIFQVVGSYCEKRDPHLAFVVYSSAGGSCDDEAIKVTNENALFKAQAKFLVDRQDLELWGKVLTDENEHKRALVDQVVSTALPQCKNSEAVACTVKAFMTANLPNELIELLEKIVLRQDSEFATNKNLQNLLILTAVQVAGAGDLPEEHKGRVMEYINRLDKFDGLDIAAICVSESLFEEAFVIYKKFDDKTKAIGVLLASLQDLERAKDYATACNIDSVWSSLAKAQLEQRKVTDAIDSYVKANDPSEYARVIAAAHDASEHHSLINFLQMARKKDFGTQEARSVIDTAMVMSYALSGQMSELEEFVSSPNLANIEEVGEKCADNGMFEAARMLFSSISKHDKLASCLVRLEKYSDAVEAARKANFTRTWKEVLVACVKAEEFRLAQMCGLHLMHIPDEIEELIKVCILPDQFLHGCMLALWFFLLVSSIAWLWTFRATLPHAQAARVSGVRASRVLRAAHFHDGVRAGGRIGGQYCRHLHGACHPLRQIQGREAHGASQALLLADEHPPCHPHLRAARALGCAVLPVRPQ